MFLATHTQLSHNPLCVNQQILNICSGFLKWKTLRSLMHTGPALTLRAIFSLMAELGPEFLRGKLCVSVMSSSASRLLKGTVKLPRVHLCLSSFTCALRKRKSQLLPSRSVILRHMHGISEDVCSSTSSSSSCLLGLWTRNEKQSSHRGSLVLNRIFTGR